MHSLTCSPFHVHERTCVYVFVWISQEDIKQTILQLVHLACVVTTTKLLLHRPIRWSFPTRHTYYDIQIRLLILSRSTARIHITGRDDRTHSRERASMHCENACRTYGGRCTKLYSIHVYPKRTGTFASKTITQFERRETKYVQWEVAISCSFVVIGRSVPAIHHETVIVKQERKKKFVHNTQSRMPLLHVHNKKNIVQKWGKNLFSLCYRWVFAYHTYMWQQPAPATIEDM